MYTEGCVVKIENIQPWLYSRVFAFLFVVFVIFEICLSVYENSLVMPTIMLIGSAIVPFSILILYFELNIYRDISLFRVFAIFLLGGAASLLFTLHLYKRFNISPNELDFYTALMVGGVEEIGKIVVSILLLNYSSKKTTTLHGLLIGGAIGCGFAVFETAGYAFKFSEQSTVVDSILAMNVIIILRSVLAFGAHVAWSAMTAAAFASKHVAKFLKVFALCVIFHTVWDWTTADTIIMLLKYPILCVLAWKIIIKQLAEFALEKQN